MQTILGEDRLLPPGFIEACGKQTVGERLSTQKFVIATKQGRWEIAKVTARQRVRGFTLTELMITLAVLVILVAIAIPSFNKLILSNRLTTTANDLVGAINSARLEAVKRNASTQFCGSTAALNTTDTLGTACGTQTGAVFLLLNGTLPASTATVLAPESGLTGSIQITSAGAAALRFNGSGLAQAPGATVLFHGVVADICTSSMSTNNHVQITMTAGSILTTAQYPPSGACP